MKLIPVSRAVSAVRVLCARSSTRELRAAARFVLVFYIYRDRLEQHPLLLRAVDCLLVGDEMAVCLAVGLVVEADRNVLGHSSLPVDLMNLTHVPAK